MKLSAIALAGVLAVSASAATAVTLIDGSTQGLYNSGIGEVLNGTNPIVDDGGVNTFLFPNNGSTPNDPTIASAPEPDLSAAAWQLGNWLTTPASPGGSWSAGPQAIPNSWAVNSETAIIYELDGGATGLNNVQLDIGVDNGVFVWLDGGFLDGALSPGGASLGEFSVSIGDIAAGTHYLQVLREDHGGGTGWSISVSGEPAPIPLPATLPLMLGVLGMGGIALRRRKTG